MEAKARLKAVVGEAGITDDLGQRQALSLDGSLLPPRLPGYIVRPADARQVAAVVSIARECRLPVVPVSSGVHTYGAALPREGGIVLDLRRLNRILEVDERNRAVRVEPGVTWGQLQEHLSGYGLRGLIPLLPHPHKSALTSTLEREPMLIPRFEYGEPLLTLEVVLGSGEVLRTGSACVPQPAAMSQGLQPEGPGLDFFRLLQGAQGTMGVVTWASLKVEFLPVQDKVLFLSFPRIEDAVAPLYSLGRLMIGQECCLLNRLDLALILGVSAEGLPPWVLLMVLSGGARRPEERIAYEEAALRETCRGLGVDLSEGLAGAPGAEAKLPQVLRRPWSGEGYWRSNYKGGHQDLFFITTPERAPGMVEAVTSVVREFGHEPQEVGVYLQPLEQGRACHLEFTFFHGESPQERHEVASLFHTAAERVLGQGALFTRPYGILADLVYPRAYAYTATLKKVKRLLDPEAILAPGRLCF